MTLSDWKFTQELSKKNFKKPLFVQDVHFLVASTRKALSRNPRQTHRQCSAIEAYSPPNNET